LDGEGDGFAYGGEDVVFGSLVAACDGDVLAFVEGLGGIVAGDGGDKYDSAYAAGCVACVGAEGLVFVVGVDKDDG